MDKKMIIVSGNLEELAKEGNFNSEDLVCDSNKIVVKYPIPIDDNHKQSIHDVAPGYLRYLLREDDYIGGIKLKIEEGVREIVYSVVPVRLQT